MNKIRQEKYAVKFLKVWDIYLTSYLHWNEIPRQMEQVLHIFAPENNLGIVMKALPLYFHY